MTVGVLAANQPLDAEPSEFLPKHAGIRLVRRGWADRISKALIRRRAQRNPEVELEQFLATTYIPESMPPREVSGCKFEDPLQLSHRMPRFRPHRAKPDVSLSVTS